MCNPELWYTYQRLRLRIHRKNVAVHSKPVSAVCIRGTGESSGAAWWTHRGTSVPLPVGTVYTSVWLRSEGTGQCDRSADKMDVASCNYRACQKTQAELLALRLMPGCQVLERGWDGYSAPKIGSRGRERRWSPFQLASPDQWPDPSFHYLHK